MSPSWCLALSAWPSTSFPGECLFFPSCSPLTLPSYINVRRATKAVGKPSVRPLLLLLPFVTAAGIQIAWLSQPEYNNSAIINSATFVPFLCAWGLQFAHQVGRMILAHVTSTPFPRWDWIWIWSIIGAVDANLPHLLGRYVLARYVYARCG